MKSGVSWGFAGVWRINTGQAVILCKVWSVDPIETVILYQTLEEMKKLAIWIVQTSWGTKLTLNLPRRGDILLVNALSKQCWSRSYTQYIKRRRRKKMIQMGYNWNQKDSVGLFSVLIFYRSCHLFCSCNSWYNLRQQSFSRSMPLFYF